MRTAQFEKEVETLLREKTFLSVGDIAAVCPGMPMPSVYSRVKKLLREGKLSVAGKGKYVSAPKLAYVVEVTPWMHEIADYLNRSCEGVNYCVLEKEDNLFVQVYKSDMDKVISSLQKQFARVIRLEDLNGFPLKLEGYIVLDRMVSESPLVDENGVAIPSLEKTMVDCVSERDQSIDRMALQRVVEAYPVNIDSMLRYAARRGVKEEMALLVSKLDASRMEMMAKVQKYLATIPVEKAWVFGSFARGEETPSSDLDLLVDYRVGEQLSLLDVIRYRNQLESIIGREVDWVEKGYLKPFAAVSAEKEKYLIYAR